MDIRKLTQADCEQWGGLLSAAFRRPQSEMDALLGWMHAGYRMVAYGAWEGATLAAQYSCLIVTLRLPDEQQSVQVGMSVNMATHPEFRGRGLVKHVAQPVYEQLATEGVMAGVGFSNAEGVKVDRHSKGYGYRVVGQLKSFAALVPPYRRHGSTLKLVEKLSVSDTDFACSSEQISFVNNSCGINHRFGCHPFRRYRFGVWVENDRLCGVVVYRPMHGGVSLMSAYAAQDYPLAELLRRWLNSLQGVGFIHFMAAPESRVRAALHPVTPCIPLPYNRHPYYLTAKSLQADTPDQLFDFARWDCMGGDIL